VEAGPGAGGHAVRGRATLRTALAGQAGAWATVPVMVLPVPRWLYSALDWGGDVTALASLVTIFVVIVWNIAWPREPEADGRGAAQDHLPQAGAPLRSMSGLRYLGPPAVATGPRKVISGGGGGGLAPLSGSRPGVVQAQEGGAAWAQGRPETSSGRCGKCGELMARHSYYGRGACTLFPVVYPRATRQGRGLLQCDGCGSPALWLAGVSVPGREEPAYVCGACA
jgi:hypothetical protein